MQFVVSKRQDLTYAVCYTDTEVTYTFVFSSYTEDLLSQVLVNGSIARTDFTDF